MSDMARTSRKAAGVQRAKLGKIRQCGRPYAQESHDDSDTSGTAASHVVADTIEHRQDIQIGPLTEEDTHVNDIVCRKEAGDFPEVLPHQTIRSAELELDHISLLRSIQFEEREDFEDYIEDRYAVYINNLPVEKKSCARIRAMWAREYYYIYLYEFIVLPRRDILHEPYDSLFLGMFSRQELRTSERDFASIQGFTDCKSLTRLEKYRDVLAGAIITSSYDDVSLTPVHARWRDRRTGEIIYQCMYDHLYTRTQIVDMNPRYKSIVITVSCFEEGNQYFVVGTLANGKMLEYIKVTTVERNCDLLHFDDCTCRDLQRRFAQLTTQSYHSIQLVAVDGHMLPCLYGVYNASTSSSCQIVPIENKSDIKCLLATPKDSERSMKVYTIGKKRKITNLPPLKCTRSEIQMYVGLVWK